MKRLIIEQSDDEFYTSHSGLALAGACINRHSDLGRQVGRLSRGNGQIADIDILRSYLGLLCLGKSDFQAITGMRDDDFFQQALWASVAFPRPSGSRQRPDEAAADGLIPLVFRSSQSMLKQLGVKVSGYADGLAARLISTGRRLILRFSRHCPVFAAFQGVYRQLVPAG